MVVSFVHQLRNDLTIKKKSHVNVKGICFTVIMAALVFVFTFTFKIPLGNGYTHLGDAFIFLSAYLLGGKRATFAAGLGGALADLASGYTMWIAPTFIAKFLMAGVCCLVAELIFKRSLLGYAVGAVAGAIVHIGAYSLAWFLLFDKAAMISAFPALTLQTVVGVVVAAVFVAVFRKTGTDNKLRAMAGFEKKEKKAEAASEGK